MLTIKVTHEFDKLAASLSRQAKQVAYASAVALTRTGQDLRSAIPAALEDALDKPTDFTKRGTYLLAARKDNLAAEVGFRPIQARYMRYQIEGGIYEPKQGGIKLPGEIQLNAFGNIPRGTIAALKRAAKDGTLGATVRKRLGVTGDRRKGAAPIQLFYGQPTGPGWEKAPVGIWRRIPPASPGAKGKLIPVVVFEQTKAVYRRRFDLLGLGQTTVDRRFAQHFDRELSKALATAR
jgi:hypothetical protein